MNYPEVLSYLGKLGNEIETMKFGLDTTRAILQELGNPQSGFPSVIVAGTNGKGSVTSFIHQVLTESGLNSGIFTSPHLERIEERVKVKNACVSRREVAGSFSRVLEAAEALDLDQHPTFFELITCTALFCFAEKGVEFGVLEVGMGGRLDSTNAVDPVLSVVTSISMDHQQYLGNTLGLIAGEKAGIFRRSVPALSSIQPKEAAEALKRKAEEAGALLEFLQEEDFSITGRKRGCYSFSFHGEEYHLGVPGSHQVENAALSLRALEILTGIGWPLDHSAKQKGISGMRRPGVLEIFKGNPDIILDGGHNPAAALKLREFLEEEEAGPLTLVFGMMRDKDIQSVASLLAPLFENVFLVPVDSPRACGVSELKKYFPEGVVTGGAEDALAKASRIGNKVVVAGSFYLAGEVRGILAGARY